VAGEHRLGMALKMSDGSHRAAPTVTLAVLLKLGLISTDEYVQLPNYHHAIIKNHRHIETGFIEAVI
jgi:L-asparaginase II